MNLGPHSSGIGKLVGHLILETKKEPKNTPTMRTRYSSSLIVLFIYFLRFKQEPDHTRSRCGNAVVLY
jgi:hypothetical protein